MKSDAGCVAWCVKTTRFPLCCFLELRIILENDTVMDENGILHIASAHRINYRSFFRGITTHRYTHVPTPVEGMPMIARAAMAFFPGLIREGHLAVLLEFDILASFLYDCYISIYIHIYISIRIYLVQSEMIISSNTVLIIVYSFISFFICGMIFLSTSHIITSVLHQFSPWLNLCCQVRRFVAEWQTTWTGPLLPPGPSGCSAVLK